MGGRGYMRPFESEYYDLNGLAVHHFLPKHTTRSSDLLKSTNKPSINLGNNAFSTVTITPCKTALPRQMAVYTKILTPTIRRLYQSLDDKLR